jgi:hypothetical protein
MYHFWCEIEFQRILLIWCCSIAEDFSTVPVLRMIDGGWGGACSVVLYSSLHDCVIVVQHPISEGNPSCRVCSIEAGGTPSETA